jgi:hypothetical protein
MTPDTYPQTDTDSSTWDTASYGTRIPLEILKSQPLDPRWLPLDGVNVAAFNSSI